jgi:hypothetical protein
VSGEPGDEIKLEAAEVGLGCQQLEGRPAMNDTDPQAWRRH